MRTGLSFAALLVIAACGAPASTTSTTGRAATTSSAMPLTPATMFCQRSGGQVIERVADGRRADLCRLSDGRTVRAADLLNSHNDL
ncbi:MAG: DUF333 domain-containing protein [Paracoccus sp. (in: a-proteobacteria)]|nr:DUF333 domain-containing protein [Paracoccus sp. (in: a-proteobacteria)]